MTYLETLESELTSAGIPRARRRRILAEFADHLHEDANVELGAPRDLAHQFADELGARLARTAAYRVFAALAFAGVALVVMFLAVGRMRGLTIEGGTNTPTPSWAAPIMLLAAIAAQVALAAGGLALLRAWRLRRERTISRTDATILARRSALGLLAGAVTLAALPTAAVAFPRAAGSTWTTVAWIVAGVGLVALAAAVPAVLTGMRLRPDLDGRSGDLIDDLGLWVPAGITPWRCALVLALAIVVVATVAGVLTADPYDGALRGITDAIACLAGFAILGRYLGLRTAR
jgi:hypothetical protein